MTGEALPPGEIHEIFTDWARGRGVKMNGVAPAKFFGQGLGIAATRKIEVTLFYAICLSAQTFAYLD